LPSIHSGTTGSAARAAGLDGSATVDMFLPPLSQATC
jgi:hypothetical protein